MNETGIKCTSSIIGACLGYLIGGLDVAFGALLILIVLDYITGLISAWYNYRLSSCKGWKGIVKKIVTLSIVIVANQIDMVFHLNSTTRSMVVYFLLTNEGLSILENLASMGIDIPNQLKQKLEQLKNEKGEEKDVSNNRNTN